MSPALLTLALFLFGLFIGIGLTLWLRRPGTPAAPAATRNAPDAFVATEPRPLPGPRPEIRRFGRHYIVNGWVLTAGDLELLGLDVG